MRNTKLERRHFVLIADVLKEFTGSSEGQAIAISFAKRLKSTNERFQTARFLEACGVGDYYDSSWINHKEKASA